MRAPPLLSLLGFRPHENRLAPLDEILTELITPEGGLDPSGCLVGRLQWT